MDHNCLSLGIKLILYTFTSHGRHTTGSFSFYIKKVVSFIFIVHSDRFHEDLLVQMHCVP